MVYRWEGRTDVQIRPEARAGPPYKDVVRQPRSTSGGKKMITVDIDEQLLHV